MTAQERERTLIARELHDKLGQAVTNVARHARASRVDVRMARDGGYLELCVSDDGKGISSRKFSGPRLLGIAGIREGRSWARKGSIFRVRGKGDEGNGVFAPVPQGGKA